MKILPTTFQPTTAQPSEVGTHYATIINGTVEVQLDNGESVTTYAIRRDDGNISAFGFVGQYRTGSKFWRCGVRHEGDRTQCRFGFDSRSGKHKKQSSVFFCPEKFYGTEVAA